MKSKFIISLCLLVTLLISVSVYASAPSEICPHTEEKAAASADPMKVKEARFLNMLNHNFAYGEDLAYEESLVNAATVALLDFAEGEFIAQDVINDYLLNMYGVEVEDFSVINAEWPQKEGYVYIIPRGYDIYKHSAKSLRANEDGSFTLITEVLIDGYDCAEKFTAKTLFVKKDNSDFGYNIISSEILDDANEI